MAKSARSKSVRKNRAQLRERVFKPASDARAERLTVKQALLDKTMSTDETKSNQDLPIVESNDKIETNTSHKSRRNKKNKPFNAYGLSHKETRF